MKYLERWHTDVIDGKRTNTKAQGYRHVDRQVKKCAHIKSYVHRIYIYMHSQKIYSPVTGVDMAFLPPAFKNNDWAGTVFLESIDTFTPSSSPRLHTQYIRLPC